MAGAHSGRRRPIRQRLLSWPSWLPSPFSLSFPSLLPAWPRAWQRRLEQRGLPALQGQPVQLGQRRRRRTARPAGPRGVWSWSRYRSEWWGRPSAGRRPGDQAVVSTTPTPGALTGRHRDAPMKKPARGGLSLDVAVRLLLGRSSGSSGLGASSGLGVASGEHASGEQGGQSGGDDLFHGVSFRLVSVGIRSPPSEPEGLSPTWILADRLTRSLHRTYCETRMLDSVFGVPLYSGEPLVTSFIFLVLLRGHFGGLLLGRPVLFLLLLDSFGLCLLCWLGRRCGSDRDLRGGGRCLGKGTSGQETGEQGGKTLVHGGAWPGQWGWSEATTSAHCEGLALIHVGPRSS